MIMKRVLLTSAVALASLQGFNNADATIYANVGVGTQGLSLGASWYFKNLIGVRAVFDYLPGQILDKTLGSFFANGTDSKAKSTFMDYGFDISVRPLMGSWHIDAGVRMMNYKVHTDAKSEEITNNLGIEGAVFSGSNDFIIAKGAKPYFGMGWDFNPIVGLTIGFDVGVIYTGSWKATTINPVFSATSYENYASIDEAEAALAAQRPVGYNSAYEDVKNVEEKPNKMIPSALKFYPVIKLNIGYKFNVLF